MEHHNDLFTQSGGAAGRHMHLVPCRWQRNGWKYVEADPAAHDFFNNPNRINSVGFSPIGKANRFTKRGGGVQPNDVYDEHEHALVTTN